MVLGASALEEPAGVIRRRGSPSLALGAALLVLSGTVPARMASAVGEDPVAEIAEALRSLGPPGGVWGRLAVEEESPAGALTPLDAVQVTLYPATPSLVTELERIRQSARTSGAQYESAIARVQAALAAHQVRIDAQNPARGTDSLVAEPPVLEPRRPVKAAPPKASAAPQARGAGPERVAGVAVSRQTAEEPLEAQHPWRQRTDPAGIFAFDAVPSGDWLVVAIRVSEYGPQKLRKAPGPEPPGRTLRFLPRSSTPPKEAEIWLTRVRVVPAERLGLDLTDRARWLAGPLH
jgi:hypothetical protein